MKRDLQKRAYSWLLLLILLAASTTASGYVNDPYLVPLQPIAGRHVELRLEVGICHFIAWPSPVLTVDGNHFVYEVTVVSASLNWGSDLCDPPYYGEVVWPLPLGELEAGEYTAVVRIINPSLPNPGTIEREYEIPFGVTAPLPIPALGGVWMMVLITVVMASGVAASLHRSHERKQNRV